MLRLHLRSRQQLRLGFLRYEPSLTDPDDTTNPYFDPRVAFFGTEAACGIPLFTRAPVNGLSSVSYRTPHVQSDELPRANPKRSLRERPIRPLYDNDGAFYRDVLSAEVANIQIPGKIYSFTSLGQLDFDLGAGQSTVYYEAFANKRESTANSGYRQFFPGVEGFTFDGNDLHPYNPFAGLEAFGAGVGFAQPVLAELQPAGSEH